MFTLIVWYTVHSTLHITNITLQLFRLMQKRMRELYAYHIACVCVCADKIVFNREIASGFGPIISVFIVITRNGMNQRGADKINGRVSKFNVNK